MTLYVSRGLMRLLVVRISAGPHTLVGEDEREESRLFYVGAMCEMQ